MKAAIRKVRPNGDLGEFLSKYVGLDYLDDSTDVGTLVFGYPDKHETRALLEDGEEYAVLFDGQEPDNSRFILYQTDGDEISDGGGAVIRWQGLSYLQLLDECLVMPRHDEESRQDQVTPAEQRAFREAAERWATNARRAQRKDDR
jgi:hypothetical protein